MITENRPSLSTTKIKNKRVDISTMTRHLASNHVVKINGVMSDTTETFELLSAMCALIGSPPFIVLSHKTRARSRFTLLGYDNTTTIPLGEMQKRQQRAGKVA